MSERQSAPTTVDLLIDAWYVVTMNASREIIHQGSVAVDDGRIVDVGKTADLEQRYAAQRRLGGERFVLTPGMVNTHIHMTGEPLTRGYVPDDTSFEENVFVWLTNLYSVQHADDERCSAQIVATEMLRTGTTSFLEAGTINFLEPVLEGLTEVGIRGKLGSWVWDRPPEPDVYRQTTDEAIARMQDQLTRFRSVADGRLGTWATVIGNTTLSDDLWRAVRQLADEHDVGMNFHMSPWKTDPDGFIAEFGHRPMVHLEELGVLREDCAIAHSINVDDQEVGIMGGHGLTVAHCPATALKQGYGVTQIGKMPEMVQRGVNLTIGTDGCNGSNYSDLMRATYLLAGLFKDGRMDPHMFPAEKAYEMATIGGAKAIGLEDEIGSLEVGKRADAVLHDTDRPEWRPLLNVINQLVWSADGRGVHTVVVDGRVVVEDGHMTTIDEAALWREAQTRGEAITVRSGLPDKAKFPVV